jgi:hypothetical protein
MEVTVEHIASAIAKARAEAELLAEQFPEHQAAFLRFAQEASRARRELLRNMQIGDNAES